MSDLHLHALDMDALTLRQIVADTDQKLADRGRERQEIRLSPWALVLGGAAFFKLLQ